MLRPLSWSSTLPPSSASQAMGTSLRAMCHPYGNRCGGAAVSEKQTRSITSYKHSSELTQTKVRINKSEWHNEGCVWLYNTELPFIMFTLPINNCLYVEQEESK